MTSWRIWLAAFATVAIFGFAIWGALNLTVEEPKPSGLKVLSGTVAEGFSYRSGVEKFPRATCGACRYGKMKLGVISIGALNVLEFDDLVVNLPSSPQRADQTSGATVTSAASQTSQGDAVTAEVVDAFSLKPLLSQLPKGLKRNLAGFRINRFTLNWMDGDALKLVLSAALVKSKGRRVFLHDVEFTRNGLTEKLPSAELLLKPRIKLVWPNGSWDIVHDLRGGQ